MTPYECHKEEIIESIRAKLGDGEVSFNTISNRLQNIEYMVSEIRIQTTKTNGRVTNMERLATIFKVVAITVFGILLIQRFGLWEILVKLL